MTEDLLLTLKRFNFALAETLPTSWALADYIPGGVVTTAHLEYRSSLNTVSFSGWAPVPAFDNATKTATLTVAPNTRTVEFRRRTPRFALVSDPERVNARVSEAELRHNALQGLFVAIEWAAELGHDAYNPLLSGDDGPNQLGLKQQTQTHYGADTAFKTQRIYNFQFAGGYIEPEHVRVQIKVGGVWQAFPITRESFTGPFHLYLDMSGIAGTITGMVIRRFTPRTTVPYQTDTQRITAPGMEPSARHAFFAAVEIGEELSKLVDPCYRPLLPSTFFTSGPYPLLVSDTLSVNAAAPGNGNTFDAIVDQFAVLAPSLTVGTLDNVLETLAATELFAVLAPSVTVGELATPTMKLYPIELFAVTPAAVTVGTLATVLVSTSITEQLAVNTASVTTGTWA